VEKYDSGEGSSAFQYFVSEKNGIFVVTFVGDMIYTAATPLDTLRAEIETRKDLKLIVLYFRDVNNVASDVMPQLTLLQKSARKSSVLRICSLKPVIKEKLVRSGVVRGAELADNLQAALSSIKGTLKIAA
jgi:anti-anti-sigma regulatory factor